jgi:hypothetical protein
VGLHAILANKHRNTETHADNPNGPVGQLPFKIHIEFCIYVDAILSSATAAAYPSAHQVELARLTPLEVLVLISLLRLDIQQRARATTVTTLPESI